MIWQPGWLAYAILTQTIWQLESKASCQDRQPRLHCNNKQPNYRVLLYSDSLWQTHPRWHPPAETMINRPSRSNYWRTWTYMKWRGCDLWCGIIFFKVVWAVGLFYSNTSMVKYSLNHTDTNGVFCTECVYVLYSRFEIIIFWLIDVVIFVWLYNFVVFKFSAKLSKLT